MLVEGAKGLFYPKRRGRLPSLVKNCAKQDINWLPLTKNFMLL